MKIKVGDTVFIDLDVTRHFVVSRISENGSLAFQANGIHYPTYRLSPRGQAFAKRLGMLINRKYIVEGKPGVYIARDHGIFEIIKGREYDITNRLLETPLADVWLKKAKATEVGYVRISNRTYEFKISRMHSMSNGSYSYHFV